MYYSASTASYSSTITRKLLIIQASYYMITKLRAHITQKCKKLNIRKCGIVLGYCRSGHIYVLPNAPMNYFLSTFFENLVLKGAMRCLQAEPYKC